jgi:hypothetical protein
MGSSSSQGARYLRERHLLGVSGDRDQTGKAADSERTPVKAADRAADQGDTRKKASVTPAS